MQAAAPETQHFSDAPCLGDAPARGMRRITVKDLADGTQTVLAKMVVEGFKHAATVLLFVAQGRFILRAIDAQPGIQIGAD
jgi:hypothetical protein